MFIVIAVSMLSCRRTVENSFEVGSELPIPIAVDFSEFDVNGVKFRMIPVAGGTFTMGAIADEGDDVNAVELPAHEVRVDAFMIGETEVTQALWQAVMDSNPSQFKGGNLPVEMIDWNDCQLFIDKLNELTGENFRLPTEAEWEYAACAGKKQHNPQYAGSDELGVVAWYDGNSKKKTHPVGTKKANGLGIYDMTGNVDEWCADLFEYYLSDFKSQESGVERVYHGGSWYSIPWYCRITCRGSELPTFKRPYLGLRLAK